MNTLSEAIIDELRPLDVSFFCYNSIKIFISTNCPLRHSYVLIDFIDSTMFLGHHSYFAHNLLIDRLKFDVLNPEVDPVYEIRRYVNRAMVAHGKRKGKK